jgi:hypothetical protein
MSPHFTLLTDRAVNDSIAVFEGRERWQSGSAIRPRMAGNAVLAMIFGADYPHVLFAISIYALSEFPFEP